MHFFHISRGDVTIIAIILLDYIGSYNNVTTKDEM